SPEAPSTAAVRELMPPLHCGSRCSPQTSFLRPHSLYSFNHHSLFLQPSFPFPSDFIPYPQTSFPQPIPFNLLSDLNLLDPQNLIPSSLSSSDLGPLNVILLMYQLFHTDFCARVPALAYVALLIDDVGSVF